MDLKGIVGIKGKSGLFKIVSSSNAKVIIVESFEDKKRFPANDPYGISQLDSTTVYGNDDALNLVDIFQNIKDKESENPVPDPKGDPKELKEFFKIVAPDFDETRVYASDIKKIISWYIILKKNNYLDESDATESESASPEETDTKPID